MGNDRQEMTRAVFLDRDGVINPTCGTDQFGTPDSPHCANDFVIFPYVGESIALLNAMGYSVLIATNQPSVAKGKTSFEEIQAMHQRLIVTVAQAGGHIQDICMCPHHPDPDQVVVSRLLKDCECRKPKPGMLLQSARKFDIDLTHSWMVGDSWKDVLAGNSAGCRTILVSPTQQTRSRCCPTFTATNLSDAVQIIRRNS